MLRKSGGILFPEKMSQAVLAKEKLRLQASDVSEGGGTPMSIRSPIVGRNGTGLRKRDTSYDQR